MRENIMWSKIKQNKFNRREEENSQHQTRKNRKNIKKKGVRKQVNEGIMK